MHDPRCRGEHGLITLEWMLIVGAIAGLAASSVLIVQRMVDDTSEVPADPLVRLLEADIAAAFVASEAQAAFDADPPAYVTNSLDTSFMNDCRTGILQSFDGVVARADWDPPADPNGTPTDLSDDEPARCTVTPVPNLGA